jgi:hypothetical protein
MRHLANSFEPADLNAKGYGLYCEFRPPAERWAEKSELRLESILNLRRFLTHGKQAKSVKKEEDAEESTTSPKRIDEEADMPSPSKKVKTEADEEKEFDDLDWSGFDEIS